MLLAGELPWRRTVPTLVIVGRLRAGTQPVAHLAGARAGNHPITVAVTPPAPDGHLPAGACCAARPIAGGRPLV
ncbi:hypothetical protein MXD59_17925 [Frankia sp. Ag45/Mut15]|uniref:Uncharacterized protein n=1 Tax=Frankia umida TaxID=573489 RepID=A0ABT0K1K9_9ACTN|nr:hypothetical protein [Frankia umida]MCK9877630.1 hypothetical protein [Frankia umida]